MLRDEHTPPTNTARAIQKCAVSPLDGRTIGEAHHGSQHSETVLKLDSYRLLRSKEECRSFSALCDLPRYPSQSWLHAGVRWRGDGWKHPWQQGRRGTTGFADAPPG